MNNNYSLVPIQTANLILEMINIDFLTGFSMTYVIASIWSTYENLLQLFEPSDSIEVYNQSIENDQICISVIILLDYITSNALLIVSCYIYVVTGL